MEIKAQFPASISRIVLVGFMGAGKSSVGALLAPLLQWRFLDADHVLEARQRATIAEIFIQHGEEKFRHLEAELIRELLDENRLVLALGGGAIESPTTRELLFLTPDTCVIFLKAPLETMISRCEQQPEAVVRPILNDRERLLSRFESRLPHYENAHMIVETASLSAEEVSKVILSAVSSLLKENIPA